MATRTNPLVSAVVLASAAAVAVATPAIAPSVQLPSPHALQAAKVQLATFADLLSITAEDWTNVVFVGYGEAISPNQDPDFDWAASYNNLSVNPFEQCDFSCTVPGISGVGYLALDALFNGNGTGYAPILEDPTKPYNETTNPYVGGYPTWSVGAINYFFEAGAGSGTAYLVAQPFGDPKSPLYNPAVAQIITQAFNGLENVTNIYVAGLTALATLALQVPTVGPYVYGAINSYLGPNTSDEIWGDYLYFGGLTGVLKYVADVIATGGNPYPPYGPQPTAATLAAAAVPAAAASVVAAPKVEAAPAEAAPATGLAKVSAPEASAPESTPAADVEVSAPAVSEVKVSAPAVSETKASAPAAVEVSVPVSTPAPEVKPVVEAPSVPDVTPSAPVADSTPAPVKDLGKEIEKAETASAGTASEPKSDASDSKAGGSDAKTGASEVKVSAPAATSSASESTSGASDAKAGTSDATSGASDAGSNDSAE
jgi:hypothetical protein